MGAPSRCAKRLVASALANPGVGRGFLHRRQERVAHLRKQLRMLVAVDEIRRAAEQFAEGRKLHHQFGMDDFGIEPPQQARAQQFRKGQEHAAIERLKVHGQRTKRRRQRDVQADRAARTVGGGGLQAR